MNDVDLLSDTVYRDQATESVERFLDDCEMFPVQKTQLYGLRQIARQQPDKVKDFAKHQRERAERKRENASARGRPGLQAEIDFWKLVGDLCGTTSETSDWSVRQEGLAHAPTELREENIPAKTQGMTPAERSRRNAIRKRQRTWIDQWENEHIPAFFERFCTHALYRMGTSATNLRES